MQPISHTTTVQARISESLKLEAEQVFHSIGLTPSDAIRVFFQQVVNEGGIPFKLRAKTPNAETQAAMRDADEGRVERFDSTDALFASWKRD